MSEPTDTEVSHHLDFEHDGQKKVFLLLILVACLLGLLVFFLLLQFAAAPAPRYFAVTANGQLLPDAPLDQPGMQNNQVANWVAENLMAIYSINFVNVDEKIKKASSAFTEAGYQNYLEVLKETGELEYIRASHSVLAAMVTAAPAITEETSHNGLYLWAVKTPLNLKYHTLMSTSERNIVVKVILVRVPSSESPLGIKILKFETPVNDSVHHALDQNKKLSPLL